MSRAMFSFQYDVIKQYMKVRFNCHIDRIQHNLGGGPLGMSVREYHDYINCDYGQDHSLDLDWSCTSYKGES